MADYTGPMTSNEMTVGKIDFNLDDMLEAIEIATKMEDDFQDGIDKLFAGKKVNRKEYRLVLNGNRLPTALEISDKLEMSGVTVSTYLPDDCIGLFVKIYPSRLLEAGDPCLYFPTFNHIELINLTDGV